MILNSRERWSDSRERNRDRHRDRYRDSDRDSYRDSDRDSYRDSDRDHYRDGDRDRAGPRHNYSEDFHHGQQQQQQQQQAKQKLPPQPQQFNPSYSQPDFWLQAAQQVSLAVHKTMMSLIDFPQYRMKRVAYQLLYDKISLINGFALQLASGMILSIEL